MKRKAFQISLFTMAGFWFLSSLLYQFSDNGKFTDLWFARIFLATICFGFGALLEKSE